MCSFEAEEGSWQSLEEIPTPNVTTIEKLVELLEIDASRLIKTMIYLADDKPIAALVSGNNNINEIKLKKSAAVRHTSTRRCWNN